MSVANSASHSPEWSAEQHGTRRHRFNIIGFNQSRYSPTEPDVMYLCARVSAVNWLALGGSSWFSTSAVLTHPPQKEAVVVVVVVFV